MLGMNLREQNINHPWNRDVTHVWMFVESSPHCTPLISHQVCWWSKTRGYLHLVSNYYSVSLSGSKSSSCYISGLKRSIKNAKYSVDLIYRYVTYWLHLDWNCETELEKTKQTTAVQRDRLTLSLRAAECLIRKSTIKSVITSKT